MRNIYIIHLTLLSGLSILAELDLREFCSDKHLNEVVAHPKDCRGFITCGEEPTVEYCVEGFHFDIHGLVCNWPDKVNCQLSSRQVEDGKEFSKPKLTSLEAFDILTGEVIDPIVGYDSNNVVCRHFGAYFLPNPHKCRSYFLCAYGHIHEHTCGPHTLWDYKLQQCVLSHQANCYHFNQEEEKELSLAQDNISMVCYPVNANTSATETLHVMNTENTSPLTTTVIAPPTPTTVTKTSTSTKKPQFSNPYNITCSIKRQSYVAHPEDCSKYFMCILGTAVMTSCPEGLLWDSKKTYCEISENVKCFQ